MKKTLLLILALILTACVSSPEGSSAPQATVTPKATPTSTPPPTETPLPTLTPTPVAVDGIAENAEGDKLAFLNGEWRMLPELDADYASMRVDENGAVVAVDADGEVAFEYDVAAQNWVEVVREPETIILAKNDQMARDIEASQMPDDIVGIPGIDGRNLPHGYLGKIFPGVSDYFSGDVYGYDNYSETGAFDSYFVVMNLADGRTVKLYVDQFTGGGGSNPISFVQGQFDLNNPLGVVMDQSRNNTPSIQADFLRKHAVGRQILFRINPSPEADPLISELIKLLTTGAGDVSKFRNVNTFEFLKIIMPDEGFRP